MPCASVCQSGKVKTEWVGQTFHRWTVRKELPKQLVECECSCGTIKQVRKDDLKRGVSKSCGCFMRDEVVRRNHARITHRKRDTRIYHIWKGMKQRCYYPKHKWFSRY